MYKVEIETSQNVSILYPTASLVERIFAYLIDMIFMVLYILVVSYALDGILDRMSTENYIRYESLRYVTLTPVLFYHLLFEIFNQGQSPGKSIMKIKVMQMDGTRAGIGSYLIRWLIGLFELTISLGSPAILCIMFSSKGQRIGDIAANTTVIKVKSIYLEKSASDSDFRPDYEMTFPKVKLLNDAQISLINTVLNQQNNNIRNRQIVELEKEIKQYLDIDDSELTSRQFLSQIVKDYSFLYWQEENKGQFEELQNRENGWQRNVS